MAMFSQCLDAMVSGNNNKSHFTGTCTTEPPTKPKNEDASGICLTIPINNLSNNNKSWIIDSGATRHICSYSEAFIELNCLSNSFVTLPNNKQITVNYYGNIKLTENITLQDVLFVPEFQFNLISVSALLINNDINITFSYNGCIIQ